MLTVLVNRRIATRSWTYAEDKHGGNYLMTYTLIFYLVIEINGIRAPARRLYSYYVIKFGTSTSVPSATSLPLLQFATQGGKASLHWAGLEGAHIKKEASLTELLIDCLEFLVRALSCASMQFVVFLLVVTYVWQLMYIRLLLLRAACPEIKARWHIWVLVIKARLWPVCDVILGCLSLLRLLRLKNSPSLSLALSCRHPYA